MACQDCTHFQAVQKKISWGFHDIAFQCAAIGKYAFSNGDSRNCVHFSPSDPLAPAEADNFSVKCHPST